MKKTMLSECVYGVVEVRNTSRYRGLFPGAFILLLP